VYSKSVTEPSREIECIGFVFGHPGYRISDQEIEKLKHQFELGILNV